MIHLQRVPDASWGCAPEEQEQIMETPLVYNTFDLICCELRHPVQC